MPLVNSFDIEAALLRPLTAVEGTYLDDIIAQATSKLTTAMPSLEGRVAAWSQDPRPVTALDPVTVASVLAGIIKRALVNPKGLWSKTESTGPFSESETYPGVRGGERAAEGSGGIIVTASDLAQLGPSRPSLPRSARLHAGLAPASVSGSRYEQPC